MEFSSIERDPGINSAAQERRGGFAKHRHKDAREKRREYARDRQSKQRSDRISEKRAHISTDHDVERVELNVPHWTLFLQRLQQLQHGPLLAEDILVMGAFISINPSSVSWFLHQGCLSTLQSALLAQDTTLQFAAASCMTNLALCTHDSLLLLYPVLPTVNQLILQPTTSIDTKIQLCWMVGNIGADCSECRKVLLHSGSFQAMLLLIDQLPDLTHEQVKVLFWSLCNCLKSIPDECKHMIDIEPAKWVLIFQYVDSCDSSDILLECLWFCTYCTANAPTLSHQFISCLYETLRKLLDRINPRDDVTIPIIRLLGNISIESTEVSSAVFSDSNMLQFLFAAISPELSSIANIKETLRFFILCCENSKFLEAAKFHGKAFTIDLSAAINDGHYDLQAISVEFLAAVMRSCRGAVDWLAIDLLTGAIIQNLHSYIKHDSDPKVLLSMFEILDFTTRVDTPLQRRVLQDLVDHDLGEAIDNIVTLCPIREITAVAERVLDRLYAFMDET